jgi:type IV pilus assembly protein PilV
LAFNTDSYTRTQATMIAYDIIDRMRANPTAVFDGLYDVGDHATAVAKISAYKDCVDDDCNCDAAACITTEDLALYDLGRWYARLSRPDVLPEATKNYSTIERNGSEVTVTIRWIDRGIPAFQRWVAEIPAWN